MDEEENKNIITPENQGKGVSPGGSGRKIIGSDNRTHFFDPSQVRVRNQAPDLSKLTQQELAEQVQAANGRRWNSTEQQSLGSNPYADYGALDHPAFYPGGDFAKQASEEQSGWQQAGNAIVGGTLNGVIKAVEALSYIPNIVSRDWEKNTFQESMGLQIDENNRDYAVYSDPNNPLSWDSSMFWGGVKGVIESGLQFAIPGKVITGGLGAISKVLSVGAREALALNGATGAAIEGIAATASKGVTAMLEGMIANPTWRTGLLEWAKSVPAGVIQNQLEGTIMGMELYKAKEQELRKAGITDEKYIKEKASEVADALRDQNMLMVLKDTWELKTIFGKPAKGVQQLTDKSRILPNSLSELAIWKKDVWKQAWAGGKNPVMLALGEAGEEMFQGGLEDNIMNESRYQDNRNFEGVEGYIPQKTDPMGSVLKYAFTDQNIFEGMMGFFGGGFQNAIVNIPGKIIDNKNYNRLVDELASVEEAITQSTDEAEQGALRTRAEQIKYEIGNTLKGHYEAQQTRVEENNEILKTKFDNLFEAHDLHEKAVFENDEAMIEAIEDNMFVKAAMDNLKKGTIGNFRSTLEEIAEGTSQATSMLDSEITTEVKEKAKKMAERLNQIETEWNRHTDPQLGERRFYNAENKRTLEKAIADSVENLDKVKGGINDKITNYNNAEKATNPQHQDIPDIDSLLVNGTAGTVKEISPEKQARIDDIRSRLSKGVSTAERNELRDLEAEKAGLNNSKNVIKAQEFLDDPELKRAVANTSGFKKHLDETLEEEKYLYSAQYRKWKDKVNSFLSKNAKNLTSDKIDEIAAEVKNLTDKVNSRDRLSEAGKKDILGQLAKLKAKLQLIEDRKLEEELLKASEELRQQKIDEYLLPFMEKAREGKGWIQFTTGKGTVFGHIVEVTTLDDEGEVTYITDDPNYSIIKAYMSYSNADGKFILGFEDMFLDGDIIEATEEQYEDYLKSKKKKGPAPKSSPKPPPPAPKPPAPTGPSGGATPGGKTPTSKTPAGPTPSGKAPSAPSPTGKTIPGEKNPEDASFTEVDLIGGKYVEVGKDKKPVTGPKIEGKPIEKQEPVKGAPVQDPDYGDKSILASPSTSISYNDRLWIQDDNGNVFNVSDERDMSKPISSQQYIVGTPIEFDIAEADFMGDTGHTLNSMPIKVLIDGDKENINQTFVPTLIGLLSTEGARDASTIGYFATPDLALSDENNRFLKLTPKGEEVIEAIEEYYNNGQTPEQRNKVIELISEPFKNVMDLNPFTRIVTKTIVDKEPIRDLSIAADELISLYGYRENIMEEFNKNGQKPIPSTISRVWEGSVARRVSNATADTENTNVVPLAKIIKDTGVQIVQVGEKTITNVLEIPMKRPDNKSQPMALVNFDANPVNRELIYAIVEDYLTGGPVVGKMKQDDFIRIMNTIWFYEFEGAYVDFNQDIQGRNQLTFKSKNGKKRFLQSKDLKDGKLSASQKGLLNTYIGDSVAPITRLDITDLDNKQTLKLTKGQLKLVKKITNKQLVIDNASTDILYVKAPNGEWIFHEQATFELDYGIEASDVNIIEERGDVAPDDTAPEGPIEDIAEDRFSIATTRESINSNPEDHKRLLDTYTITYNNMPYLIQEEFVNDMVSRIVKRYNDSDKYKKIKDNLNSVKDFYFNTLKPQSKDKWISNIDKFYDQLQNLALSKVQSMGLKIEYKSSQDDSEFQAEDFSGEMGKALERYDDSIFELNDYDRASFRLKSRLGLIATGKTSLGFIKYLDAENAFITLKKLLNNKPNMTFDESMDYLDNLKNQSVNLKQITSYIKTWDNNSKNEFSTVFKLYKSSTGILLWNTKDGSYNANIIDADRNSGGRMLVEQWQSSFFDLANDPSNNMVIEDQEEGFMINADKINNIRLEFDLLARAYNDEETKIRVDTKTKAKPVSYPYAVEVARLLNELMIDVTVEDINFIMDNPVEYAKIGEDYYRENMAKMFSTDAGIIGILFANVGNINSDNTVKRNGINYISALNYNPFTAGGNYYANIGRYISSTRGNQTSDSAINSAGNMIYSYNIFDQLTSTVSQIRSQEYKNSTASAFGRNSPLRLDNSFDIKIMDSMKRESDGEFEEAYNLRPIEIEMEELGGIQNNGNATRFVNGPTNADKSRYVKFKISARRESAEFTGEEIENNSMNLVQAVIAEGERMTQYAALRNGTLDPKTVIDENGRVSTGNVQFDNGYKFFYLLPTANITLAKERIKALLTPMFSDEALDTPEIFAHEVSLAFETFTQRYSEGFDEYLNSDDSNYAEMLNSPDLAHFLMLASKDVAPSAVEWTDLDQLVDKIISNNYDIKEMADIAVPNNKLGFISLLAADKYNEEVAAKLEYWAANGISTRGTKVSSHLMDNKWKKKLIGNGQNVYVPKTGDFRKFKDAEIVGIAAREAVYYSQYVALNYYKLISGDPATFYKGTVTGKLANMKPEEVAAAIDATMIEVVKRNAKNLASGTRPNFKILKFNEQSGKWVWTQQTHYTTATINDNKRESYNEDLMKNPLLAQMYGKGKINVADALEYTSFEEHLHVMMAKGEYNLSDELYQTLLKKAYIQDRLRWDQPIPEEARLSDAELKFVFGMMKPVQVGNVKFQSSKAVAPTQIEYYVKSSSMPLIHQVFVNMEVNKLKDGMFYEGDNPRATPIDRLAHVSAVKGGALRVAKVWEDNKINYDNLSSIYPVELSRDFFYIQQEIPYDETKNQILIMSQMDKLLLEGFAQFDGDEENSLILKKADIKKRMFTAAKEEFQKRFGVEDHGNGTYSFKDMPKVVEILKKEAYDRGFSKNAIEYLKLDKNGQLVTPMFFNSAANKYESLMTSIMSKIVLQKVHGHSYVQTSSSGVKVVGDLTTAQKNDIVYVKGYNKGEELPFLTINKVDGKPVSIEPAGVFVPFQFLSNKVKATEETEAIEQTKLDPKNFTYVDADGNTYIDPKKIDPSLLRMIGGRIPGQGPNSMLPIKILGFLPEYMGNTIVVPAEIAVQMGSDFDVDKLYTYAWNYKYSAKSGKITRYNKNSKAYAIAGKQLDQVYAHLFDSIKAETQELFAGHNNDLAYLKIRLEEAEDEIAQLADLIDTFDPSEYANPDQELETAEKELSKLTKEKQKIEILIRNNKEDASAVSKTAAFKDLQKRKAEAKALKRSELDAQKAQIDEQNKDVNDIEDLQNQYFDIHWSVLTNHNMFERISESLDMDDIAKEFDKIERNKNPQGLISPQFNRSSFLENRAGKQGVAIEANAIVLNAMMQGLDISVQNGLQTLEIPVDTAHGTLKLSMMGLDSLSKYNGSARRIHKNIQNLQSEAVDNAKYGRLGALNLNGDTFNAVNAFLMLSDPNKDTITEAGNKAQVGSVANDHVVALVTQDVIKEFIASKAKKFNQFSETKFSKREESKLKDLILEKYYTLATGQKYKGANIRQQLLSELVIPSVKDLTDARKLNLEATTPQEEAREFYRIQLNAAVGFFALDEIGQLLAGTQKSIDASTKGIGKSFIESLVKEQLYNDRIKTSINYESSYFKFNLNGTGKFVESEFGDAVEKGVVYANAVFQNMFPYRNLFNTFTEYFAVEGTVLDETKHRELMNYYKAYVFANDKLYSQPVRAERKRLLFGKDNIFDRVTKYKKTVGEGTYLMNGLVVEQDSTKKGTRRIRFAAGKSQRIDEEYNTVALLQMLTSENPATAKLGNDLITYSFLTNPIQSGNNFMMYIPSSFILGTQMNEYLNEENIKLINNTVNYEGFMEDYIRNRPEMAMSQTLYGDELQSIKLNSHQDYVAEMELLKSENNNPQLDPQKREANNERIDYISLMLGRYFRSTKNPIFKDLDENISPPKFMYIKFVIDKRTGYEKQVLYKTTKDPKSGKYIMKPVSVLGGFENKEMNSSEKTDDVVRNLESEKTKVATIVDALGLSEDETPVHSVLSNVVKYASSAHSETAKILESLYKDSPYKIVSDNKAINPGSVSHTKQLLTINPTLPNKFMAGSKLDDITSTIIHEAWHPIIDSLIYTYNTAPENLSESQRTSIKRLDILRKDAIREIKKDPIKKAEFEKFLGKYMKRLKDNNTGGRKQFEINEVQDTINFLLDSATNKSIYTSDKTITDVEKSEYYGLVNINEFVTMSWSDDVFQDNMNNIFPDEAGAKNFLQRVVDAFNELFKAFLETFGIDINENSILAQTLAESYNLVTENPVIELSDDSYTQWSESQDEGTNLPPPEMDEESESIFAQQVSVIFDTFEPKRCS